MSYGQVNADVIGTSVAGSNLGAGNASLMKSRIINGAMVISQRGTSGTATSAGSMVLDRFVLYSSNTTPTVTQSLDAPAGFVNSLLWTQSSAATRSTGDYYEIGHKIEGYNIADLNLGTANAKTFTVSFWVKSSVTGTYSFAMRNGSATYANYVSTYTISTANTWQQVTATITGATAGTWNTTNGDGLELWIDLGSGSNYQTSTYNSWIYSNQNALSSASQVGFAQTNGATFYITGVQLEVGSSATGFEYRIYSTELANCQRYYYQTPASTVYISRSCAGQAYSTSGFEGAIFSFPVSMRTSPTLINSGLTLYSPYLGRVSSAGTIAVYQSFVDSAIIATTGASSFTAGGMYYVAGNSSAYAGFNAEL